MRSQIFRNRGFFFNLALAVLMVGALSARSAFAVEKSQRDLLVVANLVTNGDPGLAWLYQFLDASAVGLAQTSMLPQYRKVFVLSGSNATRSAFTQRINSLSSDPAVKALDVMVHLHGSTNTLHFQDGSRSMSSIKAGLGNGSNPKLRMLYSTACFGNSHADDFVGAGFKVATGARGVNANSAYEYPIILSQWGLGSSMSTATAAGNNEAMRSVSDAGARAMGFPNVDSFKVIHGNGATRISSSAN